MAVCMLVSCGKTARIKGEVQGLGDGEVIVKLLDINTYKVLDTLKTDASGHFSYKVPVADGQPEFVYVFHKDTKIASLLLEKGDRVYVTADTTGIFSVDGSDESGTDVGEYLPLMAVVSDYVELLNELARE